VREDLDHRTILAGERVRQRFDELIIVETALVF
jgi:hypothetical protein